MAITTRIVGPFDEVPACEKVRAQVGLPEQLYRKLFLQGLYARGSQDKVLARMLFIFNTLLIDNHPDFFLLPLAKREDIANEIINHIMETTCETYKQFLDAKPKIEKVHGTDDETRR